MKKIECDRCGRDTEGMHIIFQGTLLGVGWSKETGRSRYQWGEDKDIDLCNDCRSDLVKILSDWFTS